MAIVGRLLLGCAMAELQQALSDELARHGRAHAEAEGFSALSLSVNLPGAQIVNATWGTTARGGGRAVDAKSLFQIGSNTKAFTAVALLTMEAGGALSTSAPIGPYLESLPKLAPYGKSTIQELLSMTAHLESYDNLRAWEDAYAATPKAEVTATSLITLVGPNSTTKPWHYSNTGYLLAEIVGNVRGPTIGLSSFEAAMDRIIREANLPDTHYAHHQYQPAVASRIVSGYYFNDDPGLQSLRGQDVTPFSLSWARSAGSMVSTPQDLAVWARRLYDTRSALPDAQMRELLSLRSTQTGRGVFGATKDDPSCFGLGTAQLHDGSYAPSDQAFWCYRGETLGFRALHVYWHGSDVVLALCINSRQTAKNDTSLVLVRALYDVIRSSLPAHRRA
jgi:D-alanyl-D-alanine carboxypeptidase